MKAAIEAIIEEEAKRLEIFYADGAPEEISGIKPYQQLELELPERTNQATQPDRA